MEQDDLYTCLQLLAMDLQYRADSDMETRILQSHGYGFQLGVSIRAGTTCLPSSGMAEQPIRWWSIDRYGS